MKSSTDENAAGRVVKSTYRAPWWLPGGHVQTIYARFLNRSTDLGLRRERWETPDNDFIDLDWLDARADSANLVVLFHGLEGCSSSHYARSLMDHARRLGWRGVVAHFRGCSGEHNRRARAYHSGDSCEIDWILRRIKVKNPRLKIYAVGVSLGGNVLLKWLGEQGDRAFEVVEKAAAVSVPVDLAAAACVLDRGCRKLIYTRHFLKTLKQKTLDKIVQHELKIDLHQVRAASTFRQIDHLFTAPVHGFESAEDYWSKASSKPWLPHIRVRTLLINSRNDPFLPAVALPDAAEVSPAVSLEYPDCGGHVGFVSGRFPGDLDWLPRRIFNFFEGESSCSTFYGVKTSFTDEKLAPGLGPPEIT
jgi:predicted alpha/beta-fold hydrolase